MLLRERKLCLLRMENALASGDSLVVFWLSLSMVNRFLALFRGRLCFEAFHRAHCVPQEGGRVQGRESVC